MSEQLYRNKLKVRLEKIGGFVFRINDVAGTGIRYSDLIWIYNGNVVFVECKVVKKSADKAYTLKQKEIATAGQLVSNYIVQNANALYIYAVYFENSKEERFLRYEHTGHIYSPAEAGELHPRTVLTSDQFFHEYVNHLATERGSLDIFKNLYER